MNRIVLAIVVVAFFSVSVPLFAAGGSSMGSTSSSSPPRKSKPQMVVASYEAGIKARDKADALAEKLATTENEKDRKKLQKKVTKEWKKAAKYYSKAVKTRPALYEAHSGLGYASRNLGYYETALTAYKEAIRLRPEYTPAIEYRGEAYLELARYDDVKEAHSALNYMDRKHRLELERAITAWMETAELNDETADFIDWANKKIRK